MNNCNFLSLKNQKWLPIDISAIKYEYKNGESSDYRKYGRNSHFIHYICDKNCRRRYINEDGTCFFAAYGDIILIPSHSKYYTDLHTNNLISVGYCITFKAKNLVFENKSPQIIGHTENPLFIKELENLTNIYLLRNDEIFAKNSAFYRLLDYIDKITDYNEIPTAVKPAFDYIDKHITEKIPLPYLAEICFMSQSQFRRVFKKYSGGVSPKNYILRRKLEYAKKYLFSTEITIDALAEMLSFYDAAALCNAYKKVFGESIGKQSRNNIEK